MALLIDVRSYVTSLLTAVLVAGCESPSSAGTVELHLYDQAVVCEEAKDSCRLLSGEAPMDEVNRGSAFISAAASRHAPRGLYLFFQFSRPSGAVAAVEVDLPTDGGDPARTHLHYQEHHEGRLVFSSSSATGRIQLPAHLVGQSSAECGCEDGLLELLFVDESYKTGDDRVRRLSRIRFTMGEGSFCRRARLLDLFERFQIEAIHSCPTVTPPTSSSGGGAGGYTYEGEAAVGCYAEEETYDDSGCGYDDSDGYDDYSYEDSGCEGDSGDWGSDDDLGCSGETYDSGGYDGYDSSGCEGDTDSSSSASCEGDAYAAAATRSRRRGRTSRGWLRVQGTVLPFFCLGLFCGYLRRRGRRPKKRKKPQPATL
jgi:hypothetical protein